MKYRNVIKGQFVERPNRFVALVLVDGKIVKVHVKNTGRCKELLVPEAVVYLEDHRDNMRQRKLEYSLIAVEKKVAEGQILINMDSQAPNKIVKEALANGKIKLPEMKTLTKIKSEATYGKSRLDFYVCDEEANEAYVEVKGVTLESDGIAMFPDAPTERGIKHLIELENAIKDGKRAFVIFIIQMSGIKHFSPNDERHRAFGDTLRETTSKGVTPLAYECIVMPDSIICDKIVEIKL